MDNNHLQEFLDKYYDGKSNFEGTDLSRQNLEGLHLTDLNFTGVNLSGANLEGAFLIRSNLTNANLSGVNLRDSELDNANFTGANIEGVDFDGAFFSDTIMPDGSIK